MRQLLRRGQVPGWCTRHLEVSVWVMHFWAEQQSIGVKACQVAVID